MEWLYPTIVTVAVGLAVIGCCAARWRLGMVPLYVLTTVLQIFTWGTWMKWAQRHAAEEAAIPEIWGLAPPQLWGIFFCGILAIILVVYILVGTAATRRLAIYIFGINVFILLLQLFLSLGGGPAAGDPATRGLWGLMTEPFEIPTPILIMLMDIALVVVTYQFFTNVFRGISPGLSVLGSFIIILGVNLGLYETLLWIGHPEYGILITGHAVGFAMTSFLYSLVLWPFLRGGLKRIPVQQQRRIFDLFRYEARLWRTTRALKTARSRYLNLFENVRELVFFADADGRLTECNEVARDMLGCDPAELTGQELIKTFCNNPEQYKALEETLTTKGAVYDWPLKLVSRDAYDIEE